MGQREYLEEYIQQSTGQKRNCLDNAVVENCFGLLKSELCDLQ